MADNYALAGAYEKRIGMEVVGGKIRCRLPKGRRAELEPALQLIRQQKDEALAKLEREIGKLRVERAQGRLFESQHALDDLERSIEAKQQELERRKLHYEEVREQLARERERILNRVIPKRYAMEGEAQVFPVSVEIRFPRKGR